MMNKFTATLIVSAGLALSPFAAPALSAASAVEPSEDSDFTAYWFVTMWGDCADGAGGRNWSAEVDYAGAPLNHELIFLNQSWVGAFPRPGIHLYEREPSRWQIHFDKIARDMDRWVPEDYTGLVIIDYERWRPVWERTRNMRNDRAHERAEDYDFLLDWRDTIRETRRDEYYSHDQDSRLQFVYDTYDEMAIRFHVETLRECKRLRPNAQWSYFNFPQLHYLSDETPRGVIGYGDLSHRASRINDKMQPIFDEMDFMVPSIYPRAWTVENNNFISELPRNRQNRTPNNEAFISSMVAEAARLGNGKPVYPIVSLQYYFVSWRPFLNAVNIRQAVEVSRDSGADGLIFWGAVTTPDAWNDMQYMIHDRLAPILIDQLGQESEDPQIADGAGGDSLGGQGPGSTGGKSGGGTVVTSVLTVDGD